MLRHSGFDSFSSLNHLFTVARVKSGKLGPAQAGSRPFIGLKWLDALQHRAGRANDFNRGVKGAQYLLLVPIREACVFEKDGVG